MNNYGRKNQIVRDQTNRDKTCSNQPNKDNKK